MSKEKENDRPDVGASERSIESNAVNDTISEGDPSVQSI